MEDKEWCATVVAFIVLTVVMVIIGYCWGWSDHRKAAISAGVAEYALQDPKTGGLEFRWKAIAAPTAASPKE